MDEYLRCRDVVARSEHNQDLPGNVLADLPCHGVTVFTAAAMTNQPPVTSCLDRQVVLRFVRRLPMSASLEARDGACGQALNKPEGR
ncbi:hypothetical protein, partial [Paraburkholderia aspalathi]|uniref:hypothetical protein n=1 Tax=Paraburkholderia aspalathi TaxID=1324617 RepID=UPI001ABF07F4